jgi:hypothetical protein
MHTIVFARGIFQQANELILRHTTITSNAQSIGFAISKQNDLLGASNLPLLPRGSVAVISLPCSKHIVFALWIYAKSLWVVVPFTCFLAIFELVLM